MEPIDHSVARPTIDVEAHCTDDLDDCCLLLCSDTGQCDDEHAYATGIGSIVATIDLSDHDGVGEHLKWQASDTAHVLVSEPLTIYVESSSLIEDADEAPGPIMDADSTRILYKIVLAEETDPAGSPSETWLLLDRNTRDAIELATGLTPSEFGVGWLTPTGAVFRGYEWSNGQLVAIEAARTVKVVGDFMLYEDYYANLVWHQISVGSHVIVCEDPGDSGSPCAEEGMSDVDVSGVAVSNLYGVITIYDGVTSALLPLAPGYGRQDIRTNGTAFLYRRSPSDFGGTYDLVLHDGVDEVALGQMSNSDEHQLNDNWIAYQAPSPGGGGQIWLRDMQGDARQQTFYSKPSEIEALGTDGSIMFKNDRRRRIVDAAGLITDLTYWPQGRVKEIDGVGT